MGGNACAVWTTMRVSHHLQHSSVTNLSTIEFAKQVTSSQQNLTGHPTGKYACEQFVMLEGGLQSPIRITVLYFSSLGQKLEWTSKALT